MTLTQAARRLPGFLRRNIIYYESVCEERAAQFAAELPAGSSLLDAGAGEGAFRHLFKRHRYVGVDLAIGDGSWNYSRLDVLGDLEKLPFPTGAFQACIHINTLEHVRDPRSVLTEIGRTLTSGGRLLVIVPHEWEVHQSPNDFFRYTRYGMEHLLLAAGLERITVEPIGGYFRLLARRLMNSLQFFPALLWPLFALLLGPVALLLPLLEPLDRNKNFTMGYICQAQKP